MRRIEIRIVGTITDTNQLDEIQDIAKIFVYEHRMKKYTPPVQHTPPILKSKTHILSHTPYLKTYTLHNVRGFA